MILRIVAALIGALFAFGLVQTQPWSHPAWTHVGLERFLIAMAAVAVLTLARIHRGWFYAAVAIVACSIGFQPILGLAFVLLGGLNLGWLLFHQKDDRLNLLAGFAIYVWIFSLTASMPINIVWVWGVLIAFPIVLARRFVFPLPRPSLPVAMPLVANFLLALKPEVSSDGLSQHFAIVQWVRDFGRFHFDAANQIWSVQPMAGDWALSIAGLFGGEGAARLLNYTWLLVLASFVYSALRRRLAEGPALLITGIFAATPLLQLTSTSMFIENFWTAMIVGALYAIDEGEIVLAATLAGASGASKLLGLTPAPALALFGLWKISKAKTKRLIPVLAAVAIFAAIAVVPYARAYLITGNPVFHYANAVFKSSLYRSDKSFSDARYPPRLQWRALYDVTFETDEFVESEPGTAGYQWLWFLPLSLIALRKATAFERAALGTALSVVLLVFSRQASLRYVEVAMPLLVIAFAPAAALIVEDRLMRRAAYCIGVGLLALNLYQTPGSSVYHPDFCLIPFSARDRLEYLTRMAPVRLLIADVNRIAPGVPVANFEGDDVAGLRGPAWTSTWHTPKFSDRFSTTRTVGEYLTLLRDFHIQYFIAPREGDWNYIAESPLEVFIETATDQIATAGTLQLVKVREHVNPVELPPAVPGSYDDSNSRVLYTGAWMIHQRFADAVNGTVSYSSDANATIRFRFAGTKLTYVFTRAFNRGSAAVDIDGVDKGLVDLRSAEPQWQSHVTFDQLGSGPHTVRIRATGPAGTFIDLDQFIVE